MKTPNNFSQHPDSKRSRRGSVIWCCRVQHPIEKNKWIILLTEMESTEDDYSAGEESTGPEMAHLAQCFKQTKVTEGFLEEDMATDLVDPGDWSHAGTPVAPGIAVGKKNRKTRKPKGGRRSAPKAVSASQPAAEEGLHVPGVNFPSERGLKPRPSQR